MSLNYINKLDKVYIYYIKIIIANLNNLYLVHLLGFVWFNLNKIPFSKLNLEYEVI